MRPARQPERSLLMWRGRARRLDRHHQRGSISVELVVLAPGLALLLLLLGAGARVVEVQGHIDGAARDAARAASLARSAAAAGQLAREAALADLGPSSWCGQHPVAQVRLSPPPQPPPPPARHHSCT